MRPVEMSSGVDRSRSSIKARKSRLAGEALYGSDGVTNRDWGSGCGVARRLVSASEITAAPIRTAARARADRRDVSEILFMVSSILRGGRHSRAGECGVSVLFHR